MMVRIGKTEHVLVRLRESVLKRLTGLLDDSKRVIRKEAAHTANVWAMVGQE